MATALVTLAVVLLLRWLSRCRHVETISRFDVARNCRWEQCSACGHEFPAVTFGAGRARVVR